MIYRYITCTFKNAYNYSECSLMFDLDGLKYELIKYIYFINFNRSYADFIFDEYPNLNNNPNSLNINHKLNFSYLYHVSIMHIAIVK